jgi:uncharacterized repeat protein (TIGR03943 family)
VAGNHLRIKPRWSAVRIATAASLGVWAALFWFLIAADRLPYYLASRTTWLAPVGALTLTLAAVGHALTARTTHEERLTRRNLRNLVILALPAVVIMAFPPLVLGSYAVERRSATIKGAYVSMSGRDISTGDLSLQDIFGLSYTGEIEKLAARAGSTSSFTGFVSHNTVGSGDEFQLNRFMVTCCPGDAVSVSLRVVGAPPGEFKPDDWVRVTGRMYPIGKEVVVDAEKVESVPRPEHPYLNQTR